MFASCIYHSKLKLLKSDLTIGLNGMVCWLQIVGTETENLSCFPLLDCKSPLIKGLFLLFCSAISSRSAMWKDWELSVWDRHIIELLSHICWTCKGIFCKKAYNAVWLHSAIICLLDNFSLPCYM